MQFGYYNSEPEKEFDFDTLEIQVSEKVKELKKMNESLTQLYQREFKLKEIMEIYKEDSDTFVPFL